MVLFTRDLILHRGGRQVLHCPDLQLQRGSITAVAGPSGSGKTSLLEALAGRLFHRGQVCLAPGAQLAWVPQQHHFLNRSHSDTFYYQQRFNSMDADDAPTVAETVPALFDAGSDTHIQRIRDLFALTELKDRPLLQLSNGEHKRLQLARVLVNRPSVLLLDHPFTGLDAAARALLEQCLVQLAADGLAIVLTGSASRLPTFVQQVLFLDGQGGAQLYAAHAFAASHEAIGPALDPLVLAGVLPAKSMHGFTDAVRMEDVHVHYGGKDVLVGVNWQVRKGERWSLSGPNGAGKSTLLSLVTGDNPQAYANNIFLFDRRRGSGESIWDIKRDIGYVSPELHLNFDKGATVFTAIASGFFDTIGLFRPVSTAQAATVQRWLQLLQLEPVQHRLLWQLPLGTQRMALLARALVKTPPLLVLDEPLQGLDEQQSARFRAIIDGICNHTDQTLIFVSHYTDDLPRCIRHHLKLRDGRVVAD